MRVVNLIDAELCGVGDVEIGLERGEAVQVVLARLRLIEPRVAFLGEVPQAVELRANGGVQLLTEGLR